MNFTVTFAPSSCSHIRLTITPSAGPAVTKVVTKDDFQVTDPEQAILGILRCEVLRLRGQGLTWAQVKQAIEARTFEL